VEGFAGGVEGFVASIDDGREDSWHKSRVGDISWRTCHNKFLDGGVFKSFSV
jgi:hypothetical protein